MGKMCHAMHGKNYGGKLKKCNHNPQPTYEWEGKLLNIYS